MDWASVFLTSDSGLRRVELDDIDAWVNSGLLSFQRYQVSKANRVGLYWRLRSWIMQNWTTADNTLCTHMEKTKVRLDNQMKRSGGGDDHQVLATFATLFLQDRGKRVLHEEQCNGRRVDVCSSDYEWIIECGDTNAKPIVKHLYATHGGQNCNYVAVMPFQPLEDDLFMYVFQRGVNWSDEAAKEIYFGLKLRFKELDGR